MKSLGRRCSSHPLARGERKLSETPASRGPMASTRSRTTRSFCSSPQTVKLAHMIRFKISLFIILILPQLNQSTSNINSVWLAKDEPLAREFQRDSAYSHHGERAPNQADQHLVDRSGEWSPTTRSQLNSVTQIQEAASSLQPSIVSIDQDGERLADIATSKLNLDNTSRRRILTDGTSRIGAPSSFSDEATSLDHLWRSNETNSQVQFDEEHNQNKSLVANNHKPESQSATDQALPADHLDEGILALIDKSLTQTSGHGNSSHDKQHEIPSAIDEYPNDLTNRSSLVQFGQQSSTSNTSDHIAAYINLINERRVSEPAGPNSARTDHKPDTHLMANRNHGKYDLTPSRLIDQRVYSLGGDHNPMTVINPRSTLAYVTEGLEDSGRNGVANFDGLRTTQPATWPQSHLTGLQYGFMPQTTLSAQSSPASGFENFELRTTPMPHLHYATQPISTSTTSQHHIQQRPATNTANHYLVPGNDQQIRRVTSSNVGRYASLPQVQSFVISSPHSNQQRRQASHLNQVVPAALLRHQSPLFAVMRPQLPPTTTTTRRPRKGLGIFGSLGDRLLSSGGGNRGNSQQQPHPSLENSFFDGPPVARVNYHHNLLRPPSYMASGNPYSPAENAGQSYVQLAGGGHSQLLVEQPTVAPAPSSYANQFYGPQHSYAPIYSTPARLRARSPVSGSIEPQLAQGSRHVTTNAHQQQHNFIPVVAVEVTKTSPAPTINNQDQESETSVETTDPSNEIEDYVASKTGQLTRGGQHKLRSRQSYAPPEGNANKHLVFDDYGSYAAGSSMGNSRDSIQGLKSPLAMATLGNQNHEHITTVKSAVFGYLPHQAGEPLVHAMSLLPQVSASRTFGSGGLPATSVSPVRASAASNMFPNYQVSDADMNSAQHSQLGSYDYVPQGVEEPPSLGLQLQANNFVQNDILHPFNGQQLDTKQFNHIVNHHHFTASPSALRLDSVKPMDVYPVNQPQNPYLDLFNHQQSQSHVSQHSPVGLLNPLIDPSVMLRNPQLTASASELNPMLPHIFLAGPNSMAAIKSPQQDEYQVQHSSQSSDSSAEESAPDQAPLRGLAGSSSSSSLNNKGNKKRSSEFFANAGQLLLSALPLLLAPTLGYMFASSPNPAARFHGPTQLNPSGSLGPGGPSTYMNSLDSGLVLNASPAPQLFTPSPPIFNLSYSPLGSTPSPISSTTSTTTSAPTRSSAHSERASGTSAVYPKLFHDTTPMPLRAPPSRSNNSSRLQATVSPNTKHQASTSQKPITLILTTLSPPPFSNESNFSEFSNRNGSVINSLPNRTAILLAYEDETLDRSNTSEYQNAAATVTTPTIVSNPDNRISYLDIGYEGVDFDAQYATLTRRNSTARGQDRVPAPVTKSNRDRNRYQYSEVIAGAGSESADDSPGKKATNTSSPAADDMSTKLYPMVTLPPLRRRTVSLVTSQGNRTMIDSSDKYKTYLDQPTLVHSSHRAASRRRRRRNETSAVIFDDFDDDTATGTSDSLAGNGSLIGSGSTPLATISLPPRTNLKVDKPASAPVKRHSTSNQLVGPDEVALISLAGGWHSAHPNVRTRRSVTADVNDQPVLVQHKPRKPFKIVKRIRRINRQEVNNTRPDDVIVAANSQPQSTFKSQPPDSLDEDASKNRLAHIVTALTVSTSQDDETGRDAGPEDQNSVSDRLTDYVDHQPLKNSPDGRRSRDEFREQMIEKKMLLDQIATGGLERGSSASESNEDHRNSSLSLVGRGQTPPVQAVGPPIEVTSTKIRLYTNDSEFEPQTPRAQRASNIVLTENTRQALANFGTLLLKDTLQIPQQTPVRRRSSRRHLPYGAAVMRGHRGVINQRAGEDPYDNQSSDPRNHRHYKDVRVAEPNYNLSNGDHHDTGTATERSSYRATPPSTDTNSNYMNDSSLDGPPRGPPPITGDDFRQPPTRDRGLTHNQSVPPQEDHRYSHRDQHGYQSLDDVIKPYKPSSVGGSFGERYSSTDVKNHANSAPIGLPLDSPVESRRPPNTTQNDIGYGNYTNRRTESMASAPSGNYNEHYNSYFNNYYTGPNRQNRDQHQASAYPDEDPRNYSVSSSSLHHSSGSPPMPNGHHPAYGVPGTYNQLPHHNYDRYPPSSDYRDHQHHSAYAHQNQHPVNTYAEPQRNDYMGGYSRPNRVPPADTPPIRDPPMHPHPYYNPSVGQANYPPPDARYSHPSDPRYDAARGHGNPSDYYAQSGSMGYGTRQQQGGMNHFHDPSGHPHQSRERFSPGSMIQPLASPADHSDAKTVDEYLKRVHFSDSDRDKLMASYLTCDGLLNDNDHCLERLSCEFSDPMNIEKANKLDRAVSSILLGHILINTYIPNQFKLRLKSASLFGYTQSGKCSRFACNKLTKSPSSQSDS